MGGKVAGGRTAHGGVLGLSECARYVGVDCGALGGGEGVEANVVRGAGSGGEAGGVCAEASGP
eukprot:scaffold265545_cov31-Tisochrysis_lutea.AAC.1